MSEQRLIKTRIEADAYNGLRARTVSNKGLLPSEGFHLLSIQLLPQQSELELDGGQEVEGFSAMSGLHTASSSASHSSSSAAASTSSGGTEASGASFPGVATRLVFSDFAGAGEAELLEVEDREKPNRTGDSDSKLRDQSRD